jgi:hypothetical protein
MHFVDSLFAREEFAAIPHSELAILYSEPKHVQEEQPFCSNDGT